MIAADEPSARPRPRARGRARRRASPAAGATARAFLDRRALLNAMAASPRRGGSTNGVLHLLAIAREAGVALTLDELFGALARHAGDREPHARRAVRGRRSFHAPAACRS